MPRNLFIYLSALAALTAPSLSLRHGAHQLRDLYAYPKYQVQFHNELPIAASDAERCKEVGVYSEEEWMVLRPGGGERRRLGDGKDVSQQDQLELIPMNFAPYGGNPGDTPHSYLCLMPSPKTTAEQTSRVDQLEEVEEELDPVQGWNALSHLDGKCLYSKQGWFTYAYCHNSYIRQFRQAAHPHPHPPGGFIPKEDTDYEAYTLGQSSAFTQKNSRAKPRPGSPKDQTHSRSTSVDAADNSPAVSFGIGASSRYLVQRWMDGTRCDKTGRPREVEVQVHCSMTTVDMIYMVKELATCQYVVIIHSPHLCGLPGFKAGGADVEMAGIKCRQVVSDEDWESWEAEGRKEREKAGREGGRKEVEGGEKERKTLALPFSDRPAGEAGEPQLRFGLAAAKEAPKDHEDVSEGTLAPLILPESEDDVHAEVIFGDDVGKEQLRELLRMAVEMMDGQGKAGGEGVKERDDDQMDEVVVVSWDEDDDGAAVLVEADMVVMDGEGERRLELGDQEKKKLEDMLRDYLSKPEEERGRKGKQGSGKKGKVNDEL
ncbi:hypothetical protein IAT38_005327 [Cryptococcus sp. DSM 104549]